MVPRRPRPLLLAFTLLACGGSDKTTASTPGANADELDVRAAIPAGDPAKYIDFVGSEAVVPAGSEKMFCVYMTYTGPDAAFFDQEAFQGKFGHHAVLLSTKEKKPDGFTEDCTDMKSLAKFEPFSITEELPAGVGVFLPAGKQVVLQFHYVNTGKKPIRVRDVARLHKRDLADVKQFAAVFVTNTADFKIDARGTGKREFDCALDRDVDLLLIGGHMHEYGAAFHVQLGASEKELESFYAVDEWKPDYRDKPPIQLFGSHPVHLTKGTVIRTTCEWKNTEDEPLEFPKEMCSSFGYAAGFKYPFVCDNGKINESE
jgi:hypothetical protein